MVYVGGGVGTDKTTQTTDAPHHTCHVAGPSISPIPNPSERRRFFQTVGTDPPPTQKRFSFGNGRLTVTAPPPPPNGKRPTCSSDGYLGWVLRTYQVDQPSPTMWRNSAASLKRHNRRYPPTSLALRHKETIPNYITSPSPQGNDTQLHHQPFATRKRYPPTPPAPSYIPMTCIRRMCRCIGGMVRRMSRCRSRSRASKPGAPQMAATACAARRSCDS